MTFLTIEDLSQSDISFVLEKWYFDVIMIKIVINDLDSVNLVQ